MDMMEKLGGAVLGVVLVLSLLALLWGLPFMLLWNWLMPAVFGLPTIGFWQAVGMQFLSGLIFKNPTTSKS
jgi:hypothetical protein